MTSRDPFENHSRISLGVNIRKRHIFKKEIIKGKRREGERKRGSARERQHASMSYDKYMYK